MASRVYLTFFGSFVSGTPGFPLSGVPLQQIAEDAAAGRLDVRCATPASVIIFSRRAPVYGCFGGPAFGWFRRGAGMRTYTATCRCGQLRAVCEGEPVRVSVFHCLECQKRSGGAFAAKEGWPEGRA